jgi:hypothetical protein
VLRIVAERNRMVVPSLFADADPEALHLRLIPLASSLDDARARPRFELIASRLSRAGLRTQRSAHDDTAALAAAAAGEQDAVLPTEVVPA